MGTDPKDQDWNTKKERNLQDPKDARAYIKAFCREVEVETDGREVPTHVDLDSGRRIILDAMTDDDAVMVAIQIHAQEVEMIYDTTTGGEGIHH